MTRLGKLLLCALLLAPLAPLPAQGQVALVQTVRVLDHTGVGTVVNLSITTTASPGLIAVATCLFDPGAGNPTVSGVQLDSTTPFTQDITRQASSTDSRGYIHSLANVSAGAHTVNVTRSSAAVPVAIYAVEISGAATASWTDGAGASATATAANPASGNFTASVTNGFWFAAFCNENAGTDATVAAGSGWTMDSTNGRNTAGASDVVSGVETRANPGSTGAFNGDFTAASANYAAMQVVYKAGGGATSEQEGFRWGVDDGNEAAHTFEAAQDTNITIADTQSRLLRALVNGMGDLASAAYTLRYQKNGSGGYTAVPVGSSTASSISNQNVAASADDGQDQGGTNTINGTTIGASLDATTEWAAMRFTSITIPAGSTITSASVGVVPSATTEDEPLVTVFLEAADNCAAYTTGASNISGRSRGTGVSWSSADLGATGASYHDTPDLTAAVQAVINRAGWASGNALCVHIQGGATGTRDLTIEAQDLGPNTNPPRLSVAWTTPNQVYVTTSANIAGGGEATTARLTAPATKSTSDFVTGRRWDDENGTDSIDITTDDYTEVEWLVFIASSAADGDFFDFRTYAAAAALDTYTLTPRWTIPSAGSNAPRAMHYKKLMSANDDHFIDWPLVANGR